MSDIESVLNHADAELDNSLKRLFDLLCIPSISADPAYGADCRRAAQWCVSCLSDLGFEAELRETTGQPMVVAHYRGAGPSAPHVLFYGHYDVQPADPIEKWRTPPFEPQRVTEKDGAERIYARGAADDKGQLMTFVEASRAWINATGRLPINVTILFEGEEESGSVSLDPFLKANREELSCDVALVCDTNMWDPQTPAIASRLRGIAHEEIVLTGPRIDLHSGYYGGAARNPIHVLTKILAGLHDDTGRVTLDGFYDGVKPVSDAVKAQWEGLDFSQADFLGDIGLELPAGEHGYSVLEQVWARPTAEVNGIIAGYTGAGTKTVIPSQASAKISFRLVDDQEPEKISQSFRRFVLAQVPDDCSVEFIDNGPGSGAVRIDEKNPYLKTAADALGEEFDRPAVMIGMGGSIPIVGSFTSILGMDSLLIGFGLGDDAIHSPNEKYDLNSFHKGIRSWVRILDKLATG